MFDLVLRSRRVVLPDGVRDACVAISGQTIAAVLDPEKVRPDVQIRDLGDKVLMPGLVDTHAHINEPGRTDWEGFATATRSCAAGGITTVVDMPLNSIPVTTSRAAFEEKLRSASGQTWVDHGFWGGVVPGNERELEPLVRAGVLGCKAFLVHSGIDDFPHTTNDDLDRAMPILTRLGVPLLVHAEVESDVPSLPADPRSYATYLASRPPSWEEEAVRRMVQLCQTHRTHVHVVHLSAATALDALALARTEALPFTVETCPHYLLLAAERIPDGRTEFKCAPPIREERNRERLWHALTSGRIDFVVSDHSPCAPRLKLPDEGDFMRAWGGVASLQFGLSLIWTEARQRGASLSDVARWMCQAPARLAGLDHRKGRIAPGLDADFVVWDPETRFTIEASRIHHRHPVTPYLGRTVAGEVVTTYLRGRKIYDAGVFCTGPEGIALLGRSGSSSSAS